MKPDNSSSLEQHPIRLDVEPTTALSLGAISEPEVTVGDLLRAAREKAGLSLGDVASRLRMGVKQVRALEQNDFPALPKGTFLRGFVRNFAKQVGVKPEQALNLLEVTHQSAAAITASVVVLPLQQNINVPLPGCERATPRGRIFIAVVIAVLLLTVIWWWWENVRPYRAEGGRPRAVAVDNSIHVPTTVPETAVNIAPPPSEAASAPAFGTAAQAAPQVELLLPPVSTPAAPIVSAVTLTSSPSAAETAPAASPVTRAGNGLLGLTFSDRSWVEVVDANGKTVLDRTFKGGDAEEVSGRAPFSVVVGNAKATRLAYNGKEIDLTPHTRAAVARLTVK